VAEIPKSADVETSRSDGGVSEFRNTSTSNGQQTVEVLKKISQLRDDSQEEEEEDAVLQVKFKNESGRKRDSTTNSQPINKTDARRNCAWEGKPQLQEYIICGGLTVHRISAVEVGLADKCVVRACAKLKSSK